MSGYVPTMRYASFWQRFCAAVVDALILSLLQMAILAVTIICVEPFVDTEDIFSMIFSAVVYSLPGGILALVIFPWLYVAISESGAWRGTLGKKLVGLRVLDTRGQRFSFWRSSFKLGVQSSIWIIIFVGLAGWPLAWPSNISDIDGFIKMGFGLYLVLCAWFCHEMSCELLLPVGLCYFACYMALVFTKRKQTLFDKLAGRVVVSNR